MIGLGLSKNAKGTKKSRKDRDNAYRSTDYALGAEQYIPFVKQLHLASQILVQSLTSGIYQQRRAGDGSRFWQHNPYQHGDPIKHIDWKASAKHGSPLILEKEAEQTQSILIHCPYHDGMDYQPQQSWLEQLPQLTSLKKSSDDTKNDTSLDSKFSAALMLSASLMHVFKKQRHPISTTASGTNARLGLSDDFIESQLALLCSPHNIDPSLMINAQRKHVIWVDDFWNDLKDVERQIIDLRNQNAIPYLIQVITIDELTLPFSGHVRFDGTNDDEDNVQDIPMVEAIRNDYQERIKTHLENLRMLCSKQNVFYKCLILGLPENPDMTEIIDDYVSGQGHSDIKRFLEDMIHDISTAQDGIMA